MEDAPAFSRAAGAVAADASCAFDGRTGSYCGKAAYVYHQGGPCTFREGLGGVMVPRGPGITYRSCHPQTPVAAYEAVVGEQEQLPVRWQADGRGALDTGAATLCAVGGRSASVVLKWGACYLVTNMLIILCLLYIIICVLLLSTHHYI